MNMRYLGGAATIAALMMSAAPAAYAQQTTAAIRGVVTSADGGPLAGATLTVVHKPTGSKTVTKSDADGVFDLRGLRVGGPYEVTATAANFDPAKLSDVFLAVGDASRLTLALEPVGVSEVVVKADRVGSKLANAGSRTNLRREAITEVVSPTRDIRDIGRRDPLATLDLATRGTGPTGGLYIAGSTPRSNRITIDGVRSADTFGLNTGGLSTNRGPVSPEAIEQFTIQATPFDVEEGDFTGGALAITLRSGGNKFHGSAFTYYRDDATVGKTFPDYVNGGSSKIKTRIEEKNYGGFFSGPIIQDRLFFALSYEKFTSSDVTLAGPAGVGFGNPINGIGGNGTVGTQADIDTITAPWSTYAAGGSKYPIGSITLTKPIIDEKYSAKIDWNIMDGQRLSASYRHAESSVWKRTVTSTSLSLDTNWYTQPEVEDNYSLQLNSTWTPEFSSEVRVAYREYTRGQTPPLGQNHAQIGICGDATPSNNPYDCGTTYATTGFSGANVTTAVPGVAKLGQPSVFFGPDQYRQANVLATKNWSGQAVGYYRLDNHLIKSGYQYKGIDIYNLFVQAAYGSYYFDSIQDFQNGRAGSLLYGNAINPKTGVAGNAKDGAAVFNYDTHTLFLQDTWDVSENLTVNYGLRYDFYKSSDKPALNPNFVNRYGFNNQRSYDGIKVLMPRISAKYTGKTFDVSGGVGLVSGGLPDVFVSNSYSYTGILTNLITIRRLADNTFVETNSGDTSAAIQAAGPTLLNINKADATFGFGVPTVANTLLANDTIVRRTAETNSLAPGFKMPTDWKANLAFRTTVSGFRLGFDAVAIRSQESLALRDLRQRPLTVNGVQQYTPDGRVRYDGLNISAASRLAQGLPVASNPDLVNLGAGRDIQAYNPDQTSTSETVAFSIGREILGADVNASYTVQRSQLYGGLSEFSTIASGLYSEQYTSFDPGGLAGGKALNTITEGFKFDMTKSFEFVRGFETKITLFGDVHSGRPINFLMNDPSASRSPTFGVNRSDIMAFIPQLTTPNAANPLQFTTTNVQSPLGARSVDVIFASAADLARFRSIVTQFNLPQGGVLDKGVRRNPWVNRFDLQLAQRIPMPFLEGHSALMTMDIANLGNLLNSRWGVVREYGDSRTGTQLINAQCASATGVASGTASAACAAYRYSYSGSTGNFSTPTVNATASTWSVVFGLKYEF